MNPHAADHAHRLTGFRRLVSALVPAIWAFSPVSVAAVFAGLILWSLWVWNFFTR